MFALGEMEELADVIAMQTRRSMDGAGYTSLLELEFEHVDRWKKRGKAVAFYRLDRLCKLNCVRKNKIADRVHYS